MKTEQEVRRELRELKKSLRKLTESVYFHLARLDKLMSEPATSLRVIKVARLANALEIENDIAVRYGLGESFKRIDSIKAKAREQ